MAFKLNWRFLLAAFLVLEMWASLAAARTAPYASMVERHEKWMVESGRVYKDEAEKAKRFNIFKENVEYIESFNEAAAARPYKLAINKFADLTNEEFQASRNGYKVVTSHPKSSSKVSSFRYANVTAAPASIDWRTKGAVTAVKDQGQCAVAATEGINQLTTGNLVSLSEQQLVDCDTSEDHGCNGVDGTCNTKKASSDAAKITGYEDVPANSESALLKAVASQPVSVAIDASGSDFQFYSSGVFTGQCGTELDHGVTAVGYGTASDGTKYWLVKNSWGTSWGENGYIRMQRDIGAAEELFEKASYLRDDQELGNECNLFSGDWVYNSSLNPLYDSLSCPYIDSQFDCLKFGRPDKQFLKYSWKPSSCNLPSLDFLRRWKGKKIMFVGDSLSLNQWNSLACMLHAADPKVKTTFVRKSPISQIIFKDYGVTIYLYTTHYLVDVVKEAKGNILKLDSINEGKAWRGMDMLIFNTWHWWLHIGAKAQGWDFIQYGSTITKDMDRLEAFSRALTTWARWVDQNVDPSKTKVFFQGISPSHGQDCDAAHEPEKGPTNTTRAPAAAGVLSKVLSTLKKPVYLLDVTALSQLRRDAHPSKYGGGHGLDCSHWCIPGLPDTWNELLYAALV
ncbi:TRICHOME BIREFRINGENCE-LIKE 37 [Perilla frutescens var. frutescens]|nr:TRICHOME BIREFRINGENCE-LIKE 37 [Perilla frutescens var. frutescens]